MVVAFIHYLFVLILIIQIFLFKTTTASCPPLIQRKGIKLTCAHENSEDPINCYGKNITIGTIATYKCADFYVSTELLEQSPKQELKCNENSRWIGLGAFYAYSCHFECGTRRGLTNEKLVIGGKNTTAERWPWHATIFVGRDKQFSYQCGGTLVNAFGEGLVILTAAHCLLDDFDVPIHPNQFRVVLGGQYSDMTENKYDFNAQIFSVQKVIIHEGYVGERELHQNDIGILKLEGLVHITNTVSPVCLSANGKLAEDQLKIGLYGEVVGFGRYTNEIGSIVEPSPTLRQASLPVVHKDGCYDWQKYHLNDSQICAGYLNELSVCKGDSGGGYVFPREMSGTTRYYLQGIVSYGYVRNGTFCENYGVFTKIHYYSTWIQNQTEEMFVSTDVVDNKKKDDVVVCKENSTVSKTTCPVCPKPEPIACPVCSNVLDPVVCPSLTEPIQLESKLEISATTNATSTEVPSPSPSTTEVPEDATKILFPESIAVADNPLNNKEKETSTSRLNELSRDIHVGDVILPDQLNSFELGMNFDYQNLALNLHNNYRALHGVPPLRLNEKLMREALNYAHKLIRENNFINQNSFGESPPTYNKNIFQLMETGAKNPSGAMEVVRQAVNQWYSEINVYNWNNPGTTTFSQLVWRSTTDLGLGVAVGNSGTTFRHVVVAAYSPPGNLLGGQYFQNNVFPKHH